MTEQQHLFLRGNPFWRRNLLERVSTAGVGATLTESPEVHLWSVALRPPSRGLRDSFCLQLLFDTFQIIRIRVAILFWSSITGCFVVDVVPCNDI